MRLHDWHAPGQTAKVPVEGTPRGVWHRIDGHGPWTTFLHGFPTSSFDWHKVQPMMPEGRSRLYVDHLGFGASSKPRMRYTFDAQIQALQGVWREHGIDRTLLVAHDYSVSMVQEILWRIVRGTWDGPRIDGATLLNGGLFYSQQKPLMIQRLLRGPLGPLVANRAGISRFRDSMHRICAVPPGEEELRDHWEAMTMYEGKRAIPRLCAYHGERRTREADWLAALQYSGLPVQLVWGLADPVSGGPMLDEVRRRTSTVRIEARDDVGHYPQLEAPEWVARWIARQENRTGP